MQATRLLGILFLSLALTSSHPGFAETVGGIIPLTISSSDLTYSISFSTGGTDTAHPEATGNLYAAIEWDALTLEPTFFRLDREGTLNIEPFYLNIASKITPPDSGTIDTNWTFGFNGLGVTINNGTASGPLPGSSGRLSPEHLDLKTSSGEIDMTFEGNGQTITERTSYLEAPEEFVLASAPLLQIEKTYSDLLRTNYRISIEYQFETEESEYFRDLNLTIDALERGRVTFTGQTEFTTKFGAWAPAATNYFPALKRGAVSSSGIPIELAYALNLDFRRHRHHTPILWTVENGRPTLRLVSRELNEDLTIERTSTLSGDDWSPIPSTWLLNGEASLKSGSTQTIEVTVPAGEPDVFLRVRPGLSSFQ